MNDINEKAKYCLNCIAKPCKSACPLGNNIPDFIKCIKEGNLREAYKISSKTTVLQSICGRICPHMQQCMGACVRGKIDMPVSIGDLEAYIGDIAHKNNYLMEDLEKNCKNKKVAIVGSGPAGLTCAAFLARRGAIVTIYEKNEKLGGILQYGIPEFRLDKKILNETIDNIISLGIKVNVGKEIGIDYSLNDLKKEYEFIFLGIGANIPWKMEIEGENLEGVFGANSLLEKQNHPNYKEKTVAVIGGGNVAMDAARTIKRLGAKKVIIIYRRNEKQMPADKKEIEGAKKDGIEFLFQNNITKIIGDKKVQKIECIKTKLIKKEGETREIPVDIENSNYELDVDYVISAIGSTVQKEIVNKLGVKQNKNGYIEISENYETSVENVFAGGDLIGTKKTVAWAAYSGRMAAEAIAKKCNN